MSTLSFTGERRVRFPAPDVARGFMLALIALANVPFWVRFFPDYPAPGQAALDAMSGVDQWWFLLRALFVDRRAYPLFSILFGFGMAIMAKRTIERERRVAREALPAELSAGWIPLQWQFFDEDVERRARRAASRLIRRRGWWMLAFGAVHSVIFQGDIIGTYGLVAVIFAEVIVMRRVWLRVIIGVTGASLSLLLLSSGAAEMGARPMTLEYHAQATLEATTPLWNLAGWLVSTPFTVLTTLVVPCVMLGVGVERWGRCRIRAAIAVRSSRLLVVVSWRGRWVRCPTCSASWTGRMWVARVGRSPFFTRRVSLGRVAGWRSLLSWAGVLTRPRRSSRRARRRSRSWVRSARS